MQFSGALQFSGNLVTSTFTSILDIANQTSDFSSSPTPDGDGFFTLSGPDTTFLNDTNYHGVGLIGTSVMCRSKYTAYPFSSDGSTRWGIRGTNLFSSRNNFELYNMAGIYKHYAEITNTRNDISGTGAPIPSLNTEFYYGLHFPDANTLQLSFNGVVCHTETFLAGWLTANGDQRPYFRAYSGAGTQLVKWCATLNTPNVADAYALAQAV